MSKSRIDELEAEYIALYWANTFMTLGMDVGEDFYQYVPASYLPNEAKATDKNVYGCSGACLVPNEKESQVISKGFTKVFRRNLKRMQKIKTLLSIPESAL